MVNEARKAELEVLGRLYLEALCESAGLDSSGSKEELIDRLLKSEGQTEPTEPTEPPEPEKLEPAEPIEPAEPGEGTGEPKPEA